MKPLSDILKTNILCKALVTDIEIIQNIFVCDIMVKHQIYQGATSTWDSLRPRELPSSVF